MLLEAGKAKSFRVEGIVDFIRPDTNANISNEEKNYGRVYATRIRQKNMSSFTRADLSPAFLICTVARHW